jgi:hypothetical protein
MYALGRTKINMADITTALGLPVIDVDRTIAALQKKVSESLDGWDLGAHPTCERRTMGQSGCAEARLTDQP